MTISKWSTACHKSIWFEFIATLRSYSNIEITVQYLKKHSISLYSTFEFDRQLISQAATARLRPIGQLLAFLKYMPSISIFQFQFVDTNDQTLLQATNHRKEQCHSTDTNLLVPSLSATVVARSSSTIQCWTINILLFRFSIQNVIW